MPNDPARPDHAAPRFTGLRAAWSALRNGALWDPGTRAVHSFWQVAVALWFVGGALPPGGLGSVPWFAGVIAGATAAVGSVAASLLTWKVPLQARPVDLLLRLLRTFAVTLAGTWVASETTVLTFDWQAATLAAALATAGALVKTVIVDGGALGKPVVEQQIAIRQDPAGFRDGMLAAMAEHGVVPLDPSEG